MDARTIVVGGGMAGLSCAMRLLDERQDFRLVTDQLGGRIQYSEQAKINYGAYFVMSGYTNAAKLATRGSWINPVDACFHNSDTERFSLLSLHTLRRLPELLRFVVEMRRFAGHYRRYKARCLELPQRAALDADPYLAALFSTPASQFIREHRLANAAADYVAKFAYACTGVGPDSLSALDFLNVSMGMLTRIHRLRFDRAAITARLGPHLVLDSVVRIERKDGGFQLAGRSGATYGAEKVVVATPAATTRDLLGLGEIREASCFVAFHLRGRLKPIYRRRTLNLFPPSSDLMLTSREHDGSYLVYATSKDVDLHRVCETFELIATVPWERAMYVRGRAYMEQQHGEGLFVAGDHNGLGLEPAAISGIYAANRIVAESRK